MQTKEKLSYNERLDVAKDIITNVKDEFKTLMERNKAENETSNALGYAILASKSIDVLQELNKLQLNILEIEQIVKEHTK